MAHSRLPGDEGEQFRLLLENVTDYAIFFTDPEGRIATWNTGAERILGFCEEEALGQPGDIIFTDEDKAKNTPEEERKAAVRNGKAADVRWHVRKDGSLFWADGILTTLYDEAGHIRGFCKILRDRTDEKRFHDALQTEYERERRIATALQNSLLLSPSIDNLRGLEVEPFYEAALEEAEVGGDFYDAFPINGGRLALVVGDASGKGIEAAARTVEVKYAVRAYLDEYRYPARALAQVNRFITEKQRRGQDDTEGFVALALVVVDPMSGEVFVSLAGAEPPFIVGRECAAAEPIESSGLPLGVDADAEYDMVTARLRPQDILVITTDGITEARDPKTRQFLGYDGMRLLAQEFCTRAGTSLRDMGTGIIDRGRAFGGGSFRDDVCMLLARLK